MSVLDFFRRKAATADPAVIESIQNRTANLIQPLGGTNVSAQMRAAVQRAQAATYAYMYANQPSVRAVIDLIAENVSQLGLKLYERVSDTERQHAGDHPAALTMRYPNTATPEDQMVQELVSDWLVYDNFYALKFPRGRQSPMTLIRLLPHMVAVLGVGYSVTGYRVFRTDGSFEDFAPERMMHARRYNPQDARVGVSRLETLRAELAQESATQAALTELAASGLSGGYIKRPLEAPEWDDDGAKRFKEGWRNARKASPRQTPVLDEGMEFVNTVITPKDAELIASREWTVKQIAQLYGVPVGLMTGEGDQEEQLKRFYSDVLAPVSQKLCSQLDLSILQAEYSATDYYFEQDLAEKLRGDLANRFPALTSAVGAPWMSRNEARAKENLPPVEDGDEMVTPLNVLVGDTPKPAPNVMPIQDPNKPPQDGSFREEPPKALSPVQFPARLTTFYERQQRVLKSQNGRPFDERRWNRELAQDLEGFAAPDVLKGLVEEINGVTRVTLEESETIEDAFEQLKADAPNWAFDIDRARVMIVAQGLLDAGERVQS